MANIVNSETYKGYTINIYWDEDAQYNDYEHFGTFYTNVPRYIDFGDGIGDILTEDGKLNTGDYICVPVYAYIHSGIALSCGRGGQFSDPWDSGLGGVMAVSKEQAKIKLGYKKCCKQLIKKVKRLLMAEVEELNHYCQGQVFMFIILDEDGGIVDSSGGFVGDDDECLQEARDNVDALIYYEYERMFTEAMRLQEDCAA